jgi:TonB family protein
MSLQLTYTIPGQLPQTVPLKNLPMVIGTLPSNHVVIRAVGVEPIHALIEDDGDDIFITDLGSIGGVLHNGAKIEVQSPIKVGDRIQIGSVEIGIEALVVQEFSLPKPPTLAPPTINYQPSDAAKASPTLAKPEVYVPTKSSSDSSRGQERASDPSENEQREKKEMLFSPRKARPTGDILECVAYWDETVLEVDLFHPSFKGYEKVLIGDTSREAHFIAAGEANIRKHVLAAFGTEGFKIQLLEGMEARFRKGGSVESASGPSKHRLGRKDIAHIKYGPVKYFLLYVRPPQIDLPRRKVRDPIIAMLTFLATVMYLAVIPALWVSTPKDMEKTEDDVWSLVQLPKKEEPPKVQVMPKPEVKVEEVKKDPPKTPPPPQPKPVKPIKPVEVEQPKQTKPADAPVPKPQVPATENLTKPAPEPKPAQPAAVPQPPTPAKQEDNKGGMASANAAKPDFKKPGEANNNPSPKSGGAVGSGMNQKGAARKGNQSVSQMGVEGPKNNQASGMNLSKLGLGVGKILDKTGPGAINTNFRNSAGGAGGGSGSASRNYGLGGVGSNSGSLGLAGSGGAVNNFGSGNGGFGGGSGGSGGLGGAGIGKGFGSGDGRGRANVSVPSSGPVVSQGLSRQEILAVIQANLNQIRHCYEQLLQRSPNSSGKLTVNFTIGASGSVTDAQIRDSSISDVVMQGCVRGRVKQWEFPKPRGAASVQVSYPFVFNPL